MNKEEILKSLADLKAATESLGKDSNGYTQEAVVQAFYAGMRYLFDEVETVEVEVNYQVSADDHGGEAYDSMTLRVDPFKQYLNDVKDVHFNDDKGVRIEKCLEAVHEEYILTRLEMLGFTNKNND